MSHVDDYEALTWGDETETPSWRTKAGVVMNVEDMETSHIQNCIRMLQRTIASRPNPYAWGEPEGDGAMDAFNSEIAYNDQLEDDMQEQIIVFERELRRREMVTDLPTERPKVKSGPSKAQS